MKEAFWCVFAGFFSFILLVIGWPYLALAMVFTGLYPLTSIAVTAALVAIRGE